MGDRILIFEDTDGDGKFDKRTVFMEGLNLVSGHRSRLRRRLGRGGAVPAVHPARREDRQARRRAEDPARRLGLRGHARDAQHVHLGAGRLALRLPRRLHALARRQAGHAGQGPHADQRRRLALSSDASTSSRSSPTARRNPWGLDFNDDGEFFIEACVIPHLFHIIQGGRYQRQAGTHFNPYTYDDIKTIADHRHYVGANPHGGNGRSDAAGGGHAHCGPHVLPGRRLAGGVPRPALHGQHPRPPHQRGRAHAEGLRLRRATATRTSCWPTTRWAIPLAIKSGPDGNVYLIDWYDKQACHRTQPGDLGPHQRPHLQDQLQGHEAGRRIWIWRRRRTRSW